MQKFSCGKVLDQIVILCRTEKFLVKMLYYVEQKFSKNLAISAFWSGLFTMTILVLPVRKT